jgi:hypothetical protein
MVDRLFGSLPPQDVGDPETFLSAAIELFAEHAPEVMERAVREIPRRSDRPTIKLMSEILADFERTARQREEAARRLPPPQERPRTPEEQQRVDRLVESVRQALRRVPTDPLPPRAPMEGYFDRIKKDLEIRKARNVELAAKMGEG